MNNFNFKEFIKNLCTKNLLLKFFSVMVAVFIFVVISK